MKVCQRQGAVQSTEVRAACILMQQCIAYVEIYINGFILRSWKWSQFSSWGATSGISLVMPQSNDRRLSLAGHIPWLISLCSKYACMILEQVTFIYLWFCFPAAEDSEVPAFHTRSLGKVPTWNGVSGINRNFCNSDPGKCLSECWNIRTYLLEGISVYWFLLH